LRLRAPQIDDAEHFFALLSIPEVTRFSNWPDAPTRPQVERFVMNPGAAIGRLTRGLRDDGEALGRRSTRGVRANVSRSWSISFVGYRNLDAQTGTAAPSGIRGPMLSQTRA
jgi:RimJ/RimL family protein N-acetyltransferase